MHWVRSFSERPDACQSNDAYIERCNRSYRHFTFDPAEPNHEGC